MVSGFVRQDSSVGGGLGGIARATRTLFKKYIPQPAAHDGQRPTETTPEKISGECPWSPCEKPESHTPQESVTNGSPKDSCEGNSHERTPGSRTKLPASAPGQPPVTNRDSRPDIPHARGHALHIEATGSALMWIGRWGWIYALSAGALKIVDV
jgi:hypothetical protein